MNAQDMFKELGFNVWQDDDDKLLYSRKGDSYSHNDDYAPCYIMFVRITNEWHEAKSVNKYRVWITFDDRSNTKEFELSNQDKVELAITQQMKELGWL